MTMPHERFRSIARMPEMLAAATADEQLDSKMRARAAALLQRYPAEEALMELVESRRQGLPPDVAEALNDAISWLQDLRAVDSLSEDLVQWRRWILRHFPRSWEVEDQRQAAVDRPRVMWSSVDEWIRPE